ncbi:MAG TPA: polysaccharide biosynthesis/export family protein [Candidatus Polarisedimenticolaceae bacterium]
MLCRVTIAATLVWIAVAVGAAAVAADEAPGATVRWESSPNGRSETLVVRFQGAAPHVDAALKAWGLELSFTGVEVAPPLPEGVRVEKDGARTRLRVERGGMTLSGFRVGASEVAFEVAVPPPVAAGSAAYTIGVGDVLSVTVYKNADLSGEFPVTPEGTVAMPLVGPVRAAGMSEAAFSEALARILAEDYLVDPQVSASVKIYQSQFVYVTGAVPRSSRVAVRPGTTLRGVLSEAGVALAQGMTVELRRSSGETSILDPAGLDTVTPKDGDVLTVQEPRYVSVYGEVRRPNRILLTPGMTLLQAIAMAEGLTEWANKKEVRILRKAGTGAEADEVLVNLNKVEDRETADPQLQADDIVIVKRRFL